MESVARMRSGRWLAFSTMRQSSCTALNWSLKDDLSSLVLAWEGGQGARGVGAGARIGRPGMHRSTKS